MLKGRIRTKLLSCANGSERDHLREVGKGLALMVRVSSCMTLQKARRTAMISLDDEIHRPKVLSALVGRP